MQESGEMPSAPLPSVSASVLCERVSSVAAFPDEAKKKLAEDDRSLALLSYLTTKFTTLKLTSRAIARNWRTTVMLTVRTQVRCPHPAVQRILARWSVLLVDKS